MSTNHDDTLSPGWPYHVPGSVVFEPAAAGVPLKMPNFVSTIGGRREENDVTFSGPTPEQIAEARKAEADAALCDQFAGQALHSSVTRAKAFVDMDAETRRASAFPQGSIPEIAAILAYSVADALMAERAKRSEVRRHTVSGSDAAEPAPPSPIRRKG